MWLFNDLRKFSYFVETFIEPQEMIDSNNIILISLAVILLLWLLPIIIIASSSKTTRREKLAWILAVIFISWFAWIFYMLLAPIKKKD